MEAIFFKTPCPIQHYSLAITKRFAEHYLRMYKPALRLRFTAMLFCVGFCSSAWAQKQLLYKDVYFDKSSLTFGNAFLHIRLDQQTGNLLQLQTAHQTDTIKVNTCFFQYQTKFVKAYFKY